MCVLAGMMLARAMFVWVAFVMVNRVTPSASCDTAIVVLSYAAVGLSAVLLTLTRCWWSIRCDYGAQAVWWIRYRLVGLLDQHLYRTYTRMHLCTDTHTSSTVDFLCFCLFALNFFRCFLTR